MQPFELPDNQRLAIEALTAGASRTKAAEKAGVNVRTLTRWLEEPAFAQALYQARQALWLDFAGAFQANATKAVAAIVASLDAPDVHLRLRAAKLLWDITTRNLKTEAQLLQAMTKAAQQPQTQPQPASSPECRNARTPECPPSPNSRTFPDMKRHRSPLQRPLLVSCHLAQQNGRHAPTLP